MPVELDSREWSRVLSALRERQRKLTKGVAKFGDDFDPEKGGGMLTGMREYNTIIHKIQEQLS